jgi:hypothetical protein
LKGEIRWEALVVTPKCLIQCFCADAVELREIGIEHHFFPANEEHQLDDILGLERESHEARKIAERARSAQLTNMN